MIPLPVVFLQYTCIGYYFYLNMQGQGEIQIPHTAKPGVVPSMYTGHPSYAYPKDKSYAEVRGYPETEGYPMQTEPTPAYPAGAPPLSTITSGAPAPCGWPGLEMR